MMLNNLLFQFAITEGAINRATTVHFPVVTLSSPGAIVFQIGSLSVRWYGILMAVAFLICYYLAEKLIVRNDLDLNHFGNLIFLVLIFSIVFARLYFVLLNWEYFQNHLDEIPKIWYGGQSIHGGILGCILAAYLYSKASKISFYKYIDVIVVMAPLGQAIGRWGNFFNNEAFGKPIHSGLLKLYIPKEFRPDAYIHNDYFHPTFLYESILDLAIFIYLFKMFPQWKNEPGKTFWVYLLCYSVVRFLVEFLRTDSIYFYGVFSYAHVVSILLILISSFALIWRRV